jgi:hypothetical protein
MGLSDLVLNDCVYVSLQDMQRWLSTKVMFSTGMSATVNIYNLKSTKDIPHISRLLASVYLMTAICVVVGRNTICTFLSRSIQGQVGRHSEKKLTQ